MNASSGPQEGDIAPDFTLPASNGEELHLAGLAGQCIVLVFFSQTFTTGDTMEIRSFAETHATLKSLGATVIGISVDPIQALRTFIQQENIPFLLCSDFDREVAKKYGVFEEEMGGFRDVARPAVFIVDSERKVIYRWVSDELHILPDLKEVLIALKESQSKQNGC